MAIATIAAGAELILFILFSFLPSVWEPALARRIRVSIPLLPIWILTAFCLIAGVVASWVGVGPLGIALAILTGISGATASVLKRPSLTSQEERC